jgi:hypothetical protein
MNTSFRIALLLGCLNALACSAASSESGSTREIEVPPGSTYVEHDGNVQIFAPNASSDPSAKPLRSLSTESVEMSVDEQLSPQMMAGPGGPNPKGGSGWCCTGCTSGPNGSLICAECHSC